MKKKYLYLNAKNSAIHCELWIAFSNLFKIRTKQATLHIKYEVLKSYETTLYF